MADNPLPIESTPRKRPAPDDLESLSSASALSTPKTMESPESMRASTDGPRQNSPSPSLAGSATTPQTNGVGTHKAKKRKLTPFEKQQKQLEKEAKERVKEEKKAQAEEKKAEKVEKERAKAEKKAQADADKEEKDRVKAEKKAQADAKKREKELEKQKKEEEQAKKARSQMKLDSLFKFKPAATPTKPPASTAPSSSLQHPSIHQDTPSTSTKDQATQSDYNKTFLPYSLPSHTVLAPENHFYADLPESALRDAKARLDTIVSGNAEDAQNLIRSAIEKRDFSSLFQIPEGFREKRGFQYPSVKELVARLSGTSSEVIDLTGEASDDASRESLEKLKAIPMKYLRFWEDIRPPYFGTFTKIQSEQQARKLALNPSSKSLPEINYDYDSEAEWEDPGEGEDLDVEDEDDIESESGDDMEGFLVDDDDPAQNKRRMITGDLEPVCSGLCWETNKGSLRKADGSIETFNGWSDYKMGVLLEPQPAAIDPFSTAYWESAPAPLPATQTSRDAFGTLIASRLPLHPRLEGNMNGSQAQPAAASGAPKPPKRTVPPEILAEFKAAIDGSDLTKIGLIEALKKQFPKIPKDAISNTLPIVAHRIGAKASEKRWALLDST
ncbi:chromatin assembly factor 1 subunit A-domain-containing protein [Phyllosticta capitalensis]